MVHLRRDHPVPLYHQVEVALRRAIEGREWADGRLPTEEALVEHYGVSRMTIRSALRRLEEDGLIERHRRRGTFVRRDAAEKIERNPARLLGFEDDLRRQGVEPSIEVLGIEEIEPPAWVTRTLGLGVGETVHRVRRLGRANGEPLWIESRYYAREIGAVMVKQDLSTASITALIEEVMPVRVSGVHLRVESAAASPLQARHLGVRAGDPLLVNQFAFFGASGRTLEVLHAAFRGDRYAFTFDLSPRSVFDVDAAWSETDLTPRNRLPGLVSHIRHAGNAAASAAATEKTA